MRTLIVATACLLALSGCFGSGSSDLTEAEAEARVASAASDFSRAFTEADAGEIRAIHGEFDVKDTGDEFSFGSGSATMDMEWGKDDAMMVAMEMDMGGFSLKFSAYCTPDAVILVWGDEAYESRPGLADECDLTGADEGMDLEEFGITDLDAEGAQIKIHSDGTITATVEEEAGTYTLHLNKAGQLTKVEVESPDMDGFFTISYGARKALDVPEATERLPASLGGWGYFSSFDGYYEWSSSFADDAYPYEEFEIRVMAGNSVVATFEPGQSGTEAGFQYTFTDDGDGKFGSGDSFTISHPDWQNSGDYDVVVWDTWAGRDVEDNPIPGVAPAIGLITLLGIALLKRR